MDPWLMDTDIPVTERSNFLSRNIDVAPPLGIPPILQRCDEEIFNGWNGSGGVNADAILKKILVIASKVAEIIKNPSTGLICISGCGTSGRLGYIVCHSFNEYLKNEGKKPCFHYLVAGGDKALFTSQELAEDDPHTGAKVLEEITAGKSKVVYIGVSCGLSASFVAGQLDYCLSNPDKFTPVVLGFNPSHLARELPIQNWDKTFLSVVNQLLEAEKTGQGFVLNPIIGPDPITGSSRMKSGSATRILLEVLAMTAIHGYDLDNVRDLMTCYKQTCDSVYRHKEQLGESIQMAGECLRSNGHIYYVGCGGKAVMAMVDASECPPTYGAALEDVRGFIDGGYQALDNNDGDLSTHGQEYRISLKDFEIDVLPFVDEKDVIVVIGKESYDKLGNAVLRTSCKKIFIDFETCVSNPSDFHLVVHVPLHVPVLQSVTPGSAKDIIGSLLQEIALKWVLNSLSTVQNALNEHSLCA